MTDTAESPALTLDEIRALLSRCATVVQPGETLIIRTDRNWNPNQVRDFQEFLDRWHCDPDESRRLPFRAVALPGEEFAVAKAGAA